MISLVRKAAAILHSLGPDERVEALEAVAELLEVETKIGKHSEEKRRLFQECQRLEEEARKYDCALSEISGLCENHLARFRARNFAEDGE